MSDTWDGVPLNPERDGWHWVVAADPSISTESAPWWWRADAQNWLPPCDVSGALPLSPARVQWRYLGPCLLPAEHAALLAERDALRADVKRLRRSWLATIQAENSCPVTGGGCLSKRCGCIEEMELLMREDDALPLPGDEA
jgi:hypothetical protein